jgi:hypothetical protein
VAVIPLEGPNTGRVIDALDFTFENNGTPKHLISDQGSVFTSAAFREFLGLYNVKIRYGAIGEHGSMELVSYYTSFKRFDMSLMEISLLPF